LKDCDRLIRKIISEKSFMILLQKMVQKRDSGDRVYESVGKEQTEVTVNWRDYAGMICVPCGGIFRSTCIGSRELRLF